MIKKEGSQYFVYSEKGKRLSRGYASKEEAEKRLRQIEAFKHMSNARVQIVNAIDKSLIVNNGDMIIIPDVCMYRDDIVMNGGLYPKSENRKAFKSFEGKMAPIGHPKDQSGNYISANEADALHNFYAGAVTRNARIKGDGYFVDLEINKKQAEAHPDGKRLLSALNDNSTPVHVSTGLNLNRKIQTGNSKGKDYEWVATDQEGDHLAILLDEPGAATPDDGVGIFVNSDGTESELLVCNMPEDSQINQNEIGFLRKILAKFANNESKDYNMDDDKQLLANKGNQKMKDGMIKALKEANMYKENMSDDDVKAAYDKLKEKKGSDKAMNQMSDLITSAVNAAVKPLSEKIEALEAVNSAAEKVERESLLKQVNMSEDEAKDFSVNQLQVMASKMKPTGSTSGLRVNHIEANAESSDVFKDYMGE